MSSLVKVRRPTCQAAYRKFHNLKELFLVAHVIIKLPWDPGGAGCDLRELFPVIFQYELFIQPVHPLLIQEIHEP